MKENFLMNQKKKLLDLRQGLLNGLKRGTGEGMAIPSEDLLDETDLAQQVIEQNITFNLKSKELEKLRRVELALERMERNSYGHCTECDQFIGEGRLDKAPFADLCIEHAEERERQQKLFSKVSG